MHSIAVVIGSILGFLDLHLAIEQVKGFWIIFTPFVPGVAWATWMRRQARLKGISYSILDEKEKSD